MENLTYMGKRNWWLVACLQQIPVAQTEERGDSHTKVMASFQLCIYG